MIFISLFPDANETWYEHTNVLYNDMLKILRKIAHWIREIVTIRFLLNVNNDEQCREKHAHIFVSQHSRHTEKKRMEKNLKICYIHYHFFFWISISFLHCFPFLSIKCVWHTTRTDIYTCWSCWMFPLLHSFNCRGRWFRESSSVQQMHFSPIIHRPLT